MSLQTHLDVAERQLRSFLETTHFASQGGIVTDLDGTVVHEDQGKVAIPQTVEFALKELYELGRPLMINSLRFPLSVIRTFGKDWYRISNAPIPTISLNGSQIGYLKQMNDGEITYEEIDAFPLSRAEIVKTLCGVEELLHAGIKEVLVFYYPRDWRKGEIIWTPVPENVDHVKEKYVSASGVTAATLEKLRTELLAEEINMVFLLIDRPEDSLMAYQHSKRGTFFTHRGVDKLSGTSQMAKTLKIDLEHSVGAGDTSMDSFLAGVGLALWVGQNEPKFKGLLDTIHLNDSVELGRLLSRFAGMQKRMAS